MGRATNLVQAWHRGCAAGSSCLSSFVRCPLQCEFQSRTMEPIMYLSLPLPASKMRIISITGAACP